jgi:putative PIN family toxin of toxin-antitoxin system
MVALIPRVVLDTNVIVAGLRSRRGASYRLLTRLDQGLFHTVISVPLLLEYEEITKSQSRQLGLTHADIDDFLDYFCSISESREIYFLWRPTLRDPCDDMLLEVAVEAGCSTIVTYNVRDFDRALEFGITVKTAREFLVEIGEL